MVILRLIDSEARQEKREYRQNDDDTNVLIEGHTDGTGSDDYNQELSEAVADYLLQQGLPDARLTTQGHGEDQPVADNETEAGCQQNRRVEVAIFANEQMVKAAERGDLAVEE